MARPVNSPPLSTVMLRASRAAFFDSAGECRDDLGTIHGAVRFEPHAFTCELVDNGQDTNRSAVGQLVTHEVRGPAMVWTSSLRLWNPLSARNFLAFHTAHL